ncbi:exonuclease domain-containing protein [Streptomyces sp. NPDC038707]|uniref:exonuclease domain-containing protein n=1 Tax=Streptomyces sp. NPDC038707 TaxID=3154329 RepID=UPI0033E88CE8
MFFDSCAPEPFLDALIEALPYEWSGSCTGPQLSDSHLEMLRQRDLARDAQAWARFLRPGEATGPGERLLLSLGDDVIRYGVVVGSLSGPDHAPSLFISSSGGLADQEGEFQRLPLTSTPTEVAHLLCRLARAADRRAIERELHEAAAEGRHRAGWFPGGRIIVLDLETTGLDTETARVVEAAWLLADHRALAWDSILIDPGVPIPQDAYNVHSIDDRLASGEGAAPSETLDALVGVLAKHISDGATLVIFNRTFDLPLLDAECGRHGLPTLADRLGRHVQAVDPMRISQRTSNRDGHALSDLAALYSTGAIAAHMALGDCLATWDVLAALCQGEHGRRIVRLLARWHENPRADEPLSVRHLLACSSGW